MNRSPKGSTAKVLAAFLMAAGPAAALAQAAPLWQPVESLRAAAEDVTRAQLGAPGQSLFLRTSLDDQLRLPLCAAPVDARLQAPGGSTVTVALSCATPSAWTIYVPVQVSRQVEVLVLNRTLSPGETVTADAVALQRRDVAQLGYGFLTRVDAATGQTVRRLLSAGTVLNPADLVPPRLVRRGEPVTLVGRAGGLTVRSEGRALADGGANDYISVQNVSSRRVVRGRVRSRQEVEVDL